MNSSGFPSQKNAVEWARMMAAARGADEMRLDGKREIYPSPLTRGRLGALLPVARELYYQKAFPVAQHESERIETLRGHCDKHIGRKKSLVVSTHSEIAAKEPWDRKTCDKEARKLLAPREVTSLRPVSPNAVGISMIPTFSAWGLLRLKISRGLSSEELRQRRAYEIRLSENIEKGIENSSVVRKLHVERFVDAVRDRAPPLVIALPPQWTSPDKTDELLEALLALLGVRNTRSLTVLVEKLSNAEYDVLVAEHSSLLQVLDANYWEPSLGAYVAFVRFLVQNGGFRGWLEAVPTKRNTALTVLKYAGAHSYKAGDFSSSGPAPLTKRPSAELSAAKLSRSATGKRRQTAVDGDSPEPDHQSPDGNDEPFTSLHLSDLAGPAARVKRQRMERLFQLLRDHENGVGVPGRSPSEPMDKHLFPGRVSGNAPAADDFTAPINEGIMRPQQAASHHRGFLARSDSATALSSVSVIPLAVAGAVATFGIVLLIAFVAFRLRFRRGGSQAPPEQL